MISFGLGELRGDCEGDAAVAVADAESCRLRGDELPVQMGRIPGAKLDAT